MWRASQTQIHAPRLAAVSGSESTMIIDRKPNNRTTKPIRRSNPRTKAPSRLQTHSFVPSAYHGIFHHLSRDVLFFSSPRFSVNPQSHLALGGEITFSPIKFSTKANAFSTRIKSKFFCIFGCRCGRLYFVRCANCNFTSVKMTTETIEMNIINRRIHLMLNHIQTCIYAVR